jgi:HEPN domain-containing protein
LTHNLLSLAQRCEIEITQDQEALLAEINEFNMASRYPSEKNRFYTESTKEQAALFLAKGVDLHLWISENLKKLA